MDKFARAINKLAMAILTASILALAGWVYAVGNRVAALEAKQEIITMIHNDVVEVRKLIIEHMNK